MAELKTKENDGDVMAFLDSIENKTRREDGYKILAMLKKVTQKEPKMWGESIIGFGKYHYKYASGREGDYLVIGFSPRKQNSTIYIMSSFSEMDDLLEKLGKHKSSVSCLYINKLADVDMDVLEQIAIRSVARMHEMYVCT